VTVNAFGDARVGVGVAPERAKCMNKGHQIEQRHATVSLIQAAQERKEGVNVNKCHEIVEESKVCTEKLEGVPQDRPTSLEKINKCT